MSHLCRIYIIENSFLRCLGPELDFLAWVSYAVELARHAPTPLIHFGKINNIHIKEFLDTQAFQDEMNVTNK